METPSSNVRTCVITLEGGRSYKIGLLRGWQFYRELKNGKRVGPYRQPLIIQGNGTLYAERIAWHHVLLKPGVKLVTSGEYRGFTFSRWNKDTHRHEDAEYPPRPPHDANLANAEQTVYAAYIVEPGAKLVFSDNTDYPESLIERRQCSLSTDSTTPLRLLCASPSRPAPPETAPFPARRTWPP